MSPNPLVVFTVLDESEKLFEYEDFLKDGRVPQRWFSVQVNGRVCIKELFPLPPSPEKCSR